jgi:hypothetical protein
MMPGPGEDPADAAPWFGHARARVIELLAGQEAERIAGAEPDGLACKTDDALVTIYAESICSPIAVPAFIQYARVEARAVLKRYWSAVQAVAAALEAAGSLTGAEIDAAIADAIERKAAEAEKARRVSMAKMTVCAEDFLLGLSGARST